MDLFVCRDTIQKLSSVVWKKLVQVMASEKKNCVTDNHWLRKALVHRHFRRMGWHIQYTANTRTIATDHKCTWTSVVQALALRKITKKINILDKMVAIACSKNMMRGRWYSLATMRFPFGFACHISGLDSVSVVSHVQLHLQMHSIAPFRNHRPCWMIAVHTCSTHGSRFGFVQRKPDSHNSCPNDSEHLHGSWPWSSVSTDSFGWYEYFRRPNHVHPIADESASNFSAAMCMAHMVPVSASPLALRFHLFKFEHCN